MRLENGNSLIACLQVRHVYANPLQRSSLASKLDMSTFRCAVVLCDELWVDPDSNDTNGIEGIDEPSVLRQDALVMVTQLNVRKLLEDSRRPPINIICQKIATEGMTRFEDRNRLPLGISINFNSFSAKLLSQVGIRDNLASAACRPARPQVQLALCGLLTGVASCCAASSVPTLHLRQI